VCGGGGKIPILIFGPFILKLMLLANFKIN